MLTVGGEYVIAMANTITRTNLSTFLPDGRNPEPKLALSLQGDGLNVEAANSRHIAIEGFELLLRQSVDDIAVSLVFFLNTIGSIWRQKLQHGNFRLGGHNR